MSILKPVESHKDKLTVIIKGGRKMVGPPSTRDGNMDTSPHLKKRVSCAKEKGRMVPIEMIVENSIYNPNDSICHACNNCSTN